MKAFLQTTTLRQLLYVSIGTALFIIATVTIALYSDRQIVDYRTDVTSGKPLGINAVSMPGALIRYDVNHYRNIATSGYTPNNAAFFPLYPLIVSGVSALDIPVNYAMLLVSWIFCILGAVVTFLWIRFEISVRKLKLSPYAVLALMAIFPTSLYLTIGYSESLFIFLTVGSLYAYRTNRFMLSAVFIALATATRVQGGALAIFYLIDFIARRPHYEWKRLIPIVAAPIGLTCYMLFLWKTFGNPFQFIQAQHDWGRLSGNIFANLFSSFTPPYLWFIPVIGIMLYAVYKYFGKAWLAYAAIFIAIPLVSGRLDSLNRYILSLPVLFLALSVWLARRPSWQQAAFIATSAFLLAWDIVFFFNDYWVA